MSYTFRCTCGGGVALSAYTRQSDSKMRYPTRMNALLIRFVSSPHRLRIPKSNTCVLSCSDASHLVIFCVHVARAYVAAEARLEVRLGAPRAAHRRRRLGA